MTNSKYNRSKGGAESGPDSSNKMMVGCFSSLIVVILLGLFLSQTTWFGSSCEPIYEEYEAILAEGRALNEEHATKDAWSFFAEEAENRINPLVEKLLEECDDHPSSTGRTIVSYLGFQSEGEKTQDLSLIHI